MKITQLSAKAIKLLKDAESFNEKFNAVEEKGDTIRLWMSFWSWGDIEEAEDIKEDWDLLPNYYPFYGDWHDIFCIYKDGEKESVVALNDDREVQASWSSVNDFLGALSYFDNEASEVKTIDEKETWLNF